MTTDTDTTDADATGTVEVPTRVTTLKFEVAWPGWRKSDLSALWSELWRAQDDLRRAANRGITALYQVRAGLLPRPEKDGKPVSDQTLSYQILSGKWQPYGTPAYVPSPDTRQVSSQVILELASVLHTRMKTDYAEVQKGNKSVPTFRSVPVGASGGGVKVDQELGTISMPLWSGRNASRVVLRPRKLDGRSWRIWRSATSFGNARLTWDRPPGRRGKWMLCISAHVPVVERTAEPMICAVRLGLYTSCTLAFAEISSGKLARRSECINLPSSTWRAVRRVQAQREERGLWNRKDHGQREGRGRQRKLRAVAMLADQVARITDTAVCQTAAAVVAMAKRNNAAVIALPDLARWSVSKEMDSTADLPSPDRAEARKRYFSMHQGALREKIRLAGQREGFRVVDVDVRRSSVTCSECGAENPEYLTDAKWECSCGCKLTSEVNTAKVLAKRAVANLNEKKAE